ncbi:MAG: hypothetical protein WBC83_03820 [Minisyncoccia bacterium]
MIHSGVSASKNKIETREAMEIIETILTVCGSLELGKNVWYATQIVEPIIIDGREFKTVGVHIHRKKSVPAHKNRFEEMMQGVKDMLEPVIVIQPLFAQARVRCVNIELTVGRRKFAGPRDSFLTIPFRKDLEQIFKIVTESLSQELRYRA